MKNLLLFICFVQLNSIVAQDTMLYYLNSRWEQTTLENAEYKRVLIQKEPDHYVVEDYLIGGLPYLRGQFHSANVKNPFGEFIAYNQSGAITEVYNYNDKSELHGAYLTFDSEGKKDTERYYTEGKKDGLWKWYYSNGLVSWFEQWRNDTLVMMQQFSEEGLEYDAKYNLNIAPRWKDNDEDLNTFIQNRLPVELQKEQVKCVIYVYITAKGNVLKIENKTFVKREIIDAIRNILITESAWLPALNRLRPIDGILECEVNIAPKGDKKAINRK